MWCDKKKMETEYYESKKVTSKYIQAKQEESGKMGHIQVDVRDTDDIWCRAEVRAVI